MKKLKYIAVLISTLVFAVYVFSSTVFADLYIPGQLPTPGGRSSIRIHYLIVGVGIIVILAISFWVLSVIRSKNDNNK